MISIEILEDMFAGIREKTTWNIDGDMLWGYFFTGSSKQELEEIGFQLESSGYDLVEVREHERESSDEPLVWQLHVERVEAHTVDTLNARNIQFEALAERYDNVIYDGMDVGPVE